MAEAPLPNDLEDLVAKRNVVMDNLFAPERGKSINVRSACGVRAKSYLIVAAVVVVVAGIQCGARLGVYLASVQPKEPDLRIFLDLLTLVLGQHRAMQSQRLCKIQTQTRRQNKLERELRNKFKSKGICYAGQCTTHFANSENKLRIFSAPFPFRFSFSVAFILYSSVVFIHESNGCATACERASSR